MNLAFRICGLQLVVEVLGFSLFEGILREGSEA